MRKYVFNLVAREGAGRERERVNKNHSVWFYIWEKVCVSNLVFINLREKSLGSFWSAPLPMRIRLWRFYILDSLYIKHAQYSLTHCIFCLTWLYFEKFFIGRVPTLDNIKSALKRIPRLFVLLPLSPPLHYSGQSCWLNVHLSHR